MYIDGSPTGGDLGVPDRDGLAFSARDFKPGMNFAGPVPG